MPHSGTNWKRHAGLKDQFTTNADLRYESGWFYELEARSRKAARDLEVRTVTTNDEGFCNKEDAHGTRSPLARNVCRKIELIQRELALIQPGWFHVGRKRDVPKNTCCVGRCGTCFVWVCPDGCKELTEFTLTVLKLSSLIKELAQPPVHPGSVKFQPGERGG